MSREKKIQSGNKAKIWGNDTLGKCKKMHFLPSEKEVNSNRKGCAPSVSALIPFKEDPLLVCRNANRKSYKF